MIAHWHRMRSGDWALRVPGERWAVGFVWFTTEGMYAAAANGFKTSYGVTLAYAKRLAFKQWEQKTNA